MPSSGSCQGTRCLARGDEQFTARASTVHIKFACACMSFRLSVTLSPSIPPSVFPSFGCLKLYPSDSRAG